MTGSGIRIAELGHGDIDEIVATLCTAFRDYPVMRYVLKGAGDNYDAHLRELVGWFTVKRVARGWPVLGALRGERLLGAANIDPPRPGPMPPALEEHFRRFQDAIGEAAMARFRKFANACEPLEPKEPHYYLGMIGVRPDCQGQGVARMLLDEVSARSAKDPVSTGVLLTTETPSNLPFYEHFGYRILGRAGADELVTWTLFRPDNPT